MTRLLKGLKVLYMIGAASLGLWMLGGLAVAVCYQIWLRERR